MNNQAIKSGAILGVVGIVITLLCYLLDSSLLGNWWFGIVFLVLYLSFVVYYGRQYRKEIGGFMTFGEAWMYSIQLLITAGLIGTLFNMLLYNVIDPELPEIMADQAVENSASMMRRFGMSEDDMDEVLEKTRTSTVNGFTVGRLLIGFGIAVIIYAILSLITGAIIKKKEPEFEG